ncbi:MAG: hypothetical protein CME04_07545 [Gemmatimonadaceae bacterium]|jgi:hypothetical protein|nr:hypothetical protein [Gemmatimonadaceae bacterium]
MADEVIRELWQIKDDIANEYRCDVETLVAHLRSMPEIEGQSLIDLSSEATSASLPDSSPSQS